MNNIEVIDVTKKFRIYHDKNITLKDRILFRNKTKYEDRCVLKGVNLGIEKGKTVGLIGKNGSGKSTLLKLLTKIIFPDTGQINVNGKISSLLELGAGFHPDFSGRENIYTNASIFGLTKKEIDKRFNQIVEFSELQDYIDSPVRTYSTGMYMRLAFSVAINVDADILLIDEILAVGDANFQKKCMDKLKDLKKKGTTIVIVTHDMGAVERICDEAVWLDNGSIKKFGRTFDVINAYLEFMGSKQEEVNKVQEQFIGEEKPDDNVINGENRWGNGDVVIEKVELLDSSGKAKTVFKSGEKVTISIRYKRYNKDIVNPVFGIGIVRNDGISCYGTNSTLDKIQNIPIKDQGRLNYIIENLDLIEGKYYIDVAVHSVEGFPYDYITSTSEFDIYSDIKDIGVIRLKHKWYLDEEKIC